ncbi:MAG: methyltransferase domain-containing protein [Candidatus Peribacteraceae bacterium]|nr:methyltransferase domain-containing protein [Candidatus Peribacteraceae bacterium]
MNFISLLRCPASGSPLTLDGDALVNASRQRYPIVNGIPRLLTPTKDEQEEALREKMQRFYEQHTFPGYDRIDSPGILIEKARRSQFGRWLDEAISPFATVLEVGCGTGQMTNFLSLVSTRTLIGIDMSIASLTLGNAFACTHHMQNVHFLQGNIFALPIGQNCVDVLICSGVLHHTPDPEGGYRELLKRVKPGGTIVIGLYNTYARIPLGLRKVLFHCTGDAFRWIDYHMRRRDVDASKKEIWYADQYFNPHESWHSVDEVLKWFDSSGVKFLSGVPAIAEKLPEDTKAGTRLFLPHPRGRPAEHVLRQLSWMFTIGKEGGLFVLVGKKTC